MIENRPFMQQCIKRYWLIKKDGRKNSMTFDHLTTVQLPLAGTDEERIEILQKAERTISTNYTAPISPIGDYLTLLTNNLVTKRATFVSKADELDQFLIGNFITLNLLVVETRKIRTGVGSVTGSPLKDFDLLELDTAGEERQILVLAEDLSAQAILLNKTLVKQATEIDDLFTKYASESDPNKQLKILTTASQQLFGENFKMVPEFQLSAEQGAEVQKVFDNKDQLLMYQTNELGVDFPVDDWLYSVARVREKMGDWENIVMLSENFTDTPLNLRPLQFPFKAEDTWLGHSYPETYKIESDKLIYTAHLDIFDPTQTQCGLLIDEWTEVIPTKTETTGLSFQYDQPNAEPPQTMLLVTPTAFKGEWQWGELVGAMHETLDLAKLRAIEPRQIAKTAYSQFIPATISAVTSFPLVTIAMNYAVNNGLVMRSNNNDDGGTN